MLDSGGTSGRIDRVQPQRQSRAAAGAGTAGGAVPGFATPLALAVVCLAAYAPALRGGMLWDDDAHVTRPALRPLAGLGRIWFKLGATQQYYPVLHTAFWVEHRLWGGAVLGYHLANVLEHAAAAWLLVLILRRMMFPAATLAGFLFALHPVCVESVAWIAEQKNTLSAVFYLAAALVYLRFDAGGRRPEGRMGTARTGGAGEGETAGGARSRWAYLAASGLFVVALLTKSVTATLPGALLVAMWWRRGRLSWRRDGAPLLPWGVVAAASGLFTAWVERHYIGAQGSAFALGVLPRVLLAGRVVWFYFGRLMWPADLMFIYPKWTIDAGEVATYAYIVALFAVLAGLARYAAKTRRRGPLAALLFFVGTLFPVLGFVNVYPFLFSYVADHFQYLASLGVIVPAAWALQRLARGTPAHPGVWRWRAAPLLLAAVALALLSQRQCRNYRNAGTLYRTTLARNPDAWLAHFNLGVLLGAEGHTREAIAQYEDTLRLNPRHWAACANLASALLKTGHTREAVAEYEAALQIRPDFPEAHNDLAVALGRLPGRQAEAVAQLEAAIRLRPTYADAHNNLGVVLMRQPGRLAEGVGELEAAVRLAPSNAEYHYNLADALADSGRLREAVDQYEQALRLDPGDVEAEGNLAMALAREGRLGDAIDRLKDVLRRRPDLEPVRRALRQLEALARRPGLDHGR